MSKKGPRVVLVHWRRDEGRVRLALFLDAELRAELEVAERGVVSLRKHRSAPPDAFAIDLTRLPAQGRAVGIWLRQQAALRSVPLVFVGGSPEKVEMTRKVLPDAWYSDWENAASVVGQATRSRVRGALVPGTMSGYSGTPLVKKLGIKRNSTVALLSAPPDFGSTLGALPEGVRVRRRAQGRADKVLLFARSIRDLVRRFPAATGMLADGGGLWLAWPKKSSGVATDLDQGFVRRYGLDRDLVDYKICAIDAVWSGLLFAKRRGGKS